MKDAKNERHRPLEDRNGQFMFGTYGEMGTCLVRSVDEFRKRFTFVSGEFAQFHKPSPDIRGFDVVGLVLPGTVFPIIQFQFYCGSIATEPKKRKEDATRNDSCFGSLVVLLGERPKGPNSVLQ